jgi:hypothetical protein
MIAMDQYTSGAFAPLVGQIFRFHRTAAADDPPIDLELLEAQASAHHGTAGRQPFSLLFALRSGEAPPQSTLHLRHDAFEPCVWFITRVLVPGRDPQTPYYEAVFG